MKHLLRFIAAAALLPLAGLHAADQPSILFIAVDDLRPELGCYANKERKKAK